MEGDRFPVERPDFKSGEVRNACLVGSTPIPFRHFTTRIDRSGRAESLPSCGYGNNTVDPVV